MSAVRRRGLRTWSYSWLASAALVVACSNHTDSEVRRDELDAARFHALLTHRDTAERIERVSIEPRSREGAEYVVVLKDTAVRRVVHAEFPGTFLDEIYRAGIAYAVKPKIPPSGERERQIDATAFRSMLEQRDEVALIARIRAEPLGLGAARYVVTIKGNPVPSVVYAEYPGAIVTAIHDAGVPYTVASE